MRKLIVILIIVFVFQLIVMNQRSIKSSDSFLRQRVLKLQNDQGSSCSGVEVKSAKGVVYTMTAGHCRDLLSPEGSLTAVDEQGKPFTISFVAEDTASDLLLLTGIGTAFVPIGESISPHEQVKAITHGKGWASFRTDGEVIQEIKVDILVGPILASDDLDRCLAKAPKQSVVSVQNPFINMSISFCSLSTIDTLSTTLILPGSSGGPLFNMKGQLVGIASAASNNDPFGRFVRLSDIQAFMAGR